MACSEESLQVPLNVQHFLSNGSTYPFSTPSLVPMSVVESDLASWNVHLNLECLHEVVGSQAAKAMDMGGSGILKAKDAESSEISKYKGVKGGRISKAKKRLVAFTKCSVKALVHSIKTKFLQAIVRST